MGLKVDVRGNVSQAFRKLQKMVEREGITRQLRKHEAYEKPSEKRRRKEIRKRQTLVRLREEGIL